MRSTLSFRPFVLAIVLLAAALECAHAHVCLYSPVMRVDEAGPVTADEWANNIAGDSRCRRNVQVRVAVGMPGRRGLTRMQLAPYGNDDSYRSEEPLRGGVCGASVHHFNNKGGLVRGSGQYYRWDGWLPTRCSRCIHYLKSGLYGVTIRLDGSNGRLQDELTPAPQWSTAVEPMQVYQVGETMKVQIVQANTHVRRYTVISARHEH